jgi:transcriptional regulator with XRE-family HTH domain
MQDKKLASQIKALRQQKGLTQEELALESGLSLRTIQRIEKAQSKAYANSIQKLANALNIHPDKLTNWQLKEDHRFLKLMNVSAFSFLFFPTLAIIIPLILWMLKKDQIQYVHKLGKKLLIFQSIWNLVLFGGLITNWYLMHADFLSIRDLQPNFFQPYREFLIFFIILMSSVNALFLIVNLYQIKRLKS